MTPRVLIAHHLRPEGRKHSDHKGKATVPSAELANGLSLPPLVPPTRNPGKTQKVKDWVAALEGDLGLPRKGPALHFPQGSRGRHFLSPAPGAAGPVSDQFSHSPQGSWLGFTGACLGGVGAIWKVPC